MPICSSTVAMWQPCCTDYFLEEGFCVSVSQVVVAMVAQACQLQDLTFLLAIKHLTLSRL